jgi:PAS domain S-box-containing protein
VVIDPSTSQPTELALLHQQIATLKQQVTELQAFKDLIDTAFDGIVLTDETGTIIYANAAYQQMAGIRDQAADHRFGEQIWHADQVDADPNPTPIMLRQDAWAGMVRYQRPDGTFWHGDTSTFRLARPILQYASIIRDASGYYAQEQRLRVFQTVSDTAPSGVVITDAAWQITYTNRAYQEMTGRRTTLLGTLLTDLHTHEPEILATLLHAVEQQGSWNGLMTVQQPDGVVRIIDATAFTFRSGEGILAGVALLATDITDRVLADAERIQLQQQVIETQQATLRELSTPLIPIADRVVAMPIIGSIDTQRANQIIETLLHGVANARANTAIIDITGVPVIDTQIASTLIQAAQAIKLLGATALLTGIRPEVAQTIVSLGLDLRDLITCQTLQDGIALALNQQRARQ